MFLLIFKKNVAKHFFIKSFNKKRFHNVFYKMIKKNIAKHFL
jgi:hypothetical protein